tara:strand:- start:826 stop:2748 length:1923 start_codon:yes stop_codon:yes gene_type:complete
MDKPEFNKKELQEIKKGTREVRDLAKKYGYEMSIVDGLTARVLKNMEDIVDAGKKGTDAAKAEIKFREQSNDLTKEILENVANIGTEEFKTFDVSKKLAVARRKGYKTAVAQLEIAKKINKEQQQQHKNIQNITKIAKKPFEAIDSFIRQIPILGDLLADVADFTGLGENFAGGIVEGFTSGFVENANLAGKVSQSLWGDGKTWNQVQKALGGLGLTSEEILSAYYSQGKTVEGMASKFQMMSVSGKALLSGGILLAAVLGKIAASAISFANSTGLAYLDVLRMGPALLVNANAVKAFANELGTVNNLTGWQALNLKIIEKRYGLSAESAAKLFAVQRGITGASMDTFLAQQRSTAEMARTAGVAPAAVFDDMAQNAEYIAKFTDGSADNMAKAAIAARRMGLNLGKVESIAEGLLDFETSIEKQMQAQVLLGRSLNLDRARTLFYEEKHEEALQEVANQLGGIGKLNDMDFIQKKAVADLLNVQVSDLSKMLGAQQNVNEAAEQQKSSMLGSVAAGAALGAILVGTVMALKAVFLKGKTLKSDTKNAIAGYAAGMTAGAVAGGVAMAYYKSTSGQMQDFISRPGEPPREFSPNDTIIGTKGALVDNTGIESRMDKLIEQNQFLMNKLIRTTGELSLNNA